MVHKLQFLDMLTSTGRCLAFFNSSHHNVYLVLSHFPLMIIDVAYLFILIGLRLVTLSETNSSVSCPGLIKMVIHLLGTEKKGVAVGMWP